MKQMNKLSRRELEVLHLLLQGKSNKLIALALDISDRTVEFHLKNVYAKFQVSSRMELVLKLGNTPGDAIEVPYYKCDPVGGRDHRGGPLGRTDHRYNRFTACTGRVFAVHYGVFAQ